MVLMIIYTRIDLGRQQKTETVKIETEAKNSEEKGTLLLTGKLEDALNGGLDADSAAEETEASKEEGEILGPAVKMNLRVARKEPYGLVVELDYVSASKISLHALCIIKSAIGSLLPVPPTILLSSKGIFSFILISLSKKIYRSYGTNIISLI